MEATKQMQGYFEKIEVQCQKEFKFASLARKAGCDPELTVEISLAKNMAERVVGLISVLAPQIKDSGVVERIIELEKEYGALDWRVSLIIALEVAQEKFCKFADKKEAIEVGIRTGFAYSTVGVVSSPLDGLIDIEFKQRKDGIGEYMCLNYAGPIRNAGGTNAALSVLIGDFVRKKMGYALYDVDESEINRAKTELRDYHERVTNLQYKPSDEETELLMKNIPVEINGDPSEKFEVSNYKDLPRVKTNLIRSGYCLILSSCIPLKAEKLWKQLSKWGHEFSMEQWDFLEELCNLKKKMHAKGGSKTKEAKITPDHTYISDLPAGRPVLGHPLAKGAFRLRYGRGRTSGYSAQSIHPATMRVLNNFIATGSQLKSERPGKGTVVSACDTIEGPIVKLDDGSVMRLESEAEARIYRRRVTEVLFLGDLLIAYGDFFNRAHTLCPAGYCEEWWIQEFEKSVVSMFGTIDLYKVSELIDTKQERIEKWISDFLRSHPDAFESVVISEKFNIPLHPHYTFHWADILAEQLFLLLTWIGSGSTVIEDSKIQKIILKKDAACKRILEVLGVPHITSPEFVIIQKDFAHTLMTSLGLSVDHFTGSVEKAKKIVEESMENTTMDIINKISSVKLRDKSGIYIGSRMGRPEKAKMRKLRGSPHMLFPVGEQGGKMRSFQHALEVGKIVGDFPLYLCESCGNETIFSVCEKCGALTRKVFFCPECNSVIPSPVCSKHGKCGFVKDKSIDIRHYFQSCMKKLNLTVFPDLIKGVKGTSNADHIPEHLAKGILRAKHGIYVNRDGTIRFDCTELTCTHFKPKEIRASVGRLVELGYSHDIKGMPLESEDQVLELKPQDVILPSPIDSPDEPSDSVFFRVCAFIDDLLVNLYDSAPFYNLKSKDDLSGHLIIGLAPHTSAGIVGRIIGFSKHQVFFAHPYFHAACRRDCFDYNTYLPIKTNNQWSISKIGDLVERINPLKKVDGFGTLEADADGFSTLGKLSEIKVNNFSKHTPRRMFEIKTILGKTLRVTENHKFPVSGKIIRASELKLGDALAVPIFSKISEKDKTEINLFKIFQDHSVMIHGINKILAPKRTAAIKRGLGNYYFRDSYPIKTVLDFLKKKIISKKELYENAKIGFKRDRMSVPLKIKLTDELLEVIGLYVAEGYSRRVTKKKGLNQVYIASSDADLRKKVERTIFECFGLKKSEKKSDRVTFSSRILYDIVTAYLKCGCTAHEKRIPPVFLDLPKKRLACVLRGYFEGDCSVEKGNIKISCDTVSAGLLADLEFCLSRFGISCRRHEYCKKPGPKLREFYIRKNRAIPEFRITKLSVLNQFAERFAGSIGFISKKKQSILNAYNFSSIRKGNYDFDKRFVYDKITSIRDLGEKESYCLNVEGHLVCANSILSCQCDGDEVGFMLLMDAFLNFSKKYLPSSRGSTMDCPLVLTSFLNPAEVDDMVFDVDIAWKYPLEFYEAALNYKMPWEVKIAQIKPTLGTSAQYEGMGFTHDTDNLNDGVACSAYKTLPSMEEKLRDQMDLAEKLRCVEESDVARLVIEKHFIRDIRGNLRKFPMQQFRCVSCNSKFRRVPLVGKCTACGGKLIFTISEGFVTKYLGPSISLASKYNVSEYLKQSLLLTKQRIEGVFGKEREKQEGLGKWFG